MESPTYTASEIKAMCSKMELDYEAFKVLADLIDEEIDLYSEDELVILCEASMMIFSRSMLKLSLKNIR